MVYGVTKTLRITLIYFKYDDSSQRIRSENSFGEPIILTDSPEEEYKQKQINEEVLFIILII